MVPPSMPVTALPLAVPNQLDIILIKLNIRSYRRFKYENFKIKIILSFPRTCPLCCKAQQAGRNQAKISWIPFFKGMTALVVFGFCCKYKCSIRPPSDRRSGKEEITINPGEDSAVNVRFITLESPVSGIVRVADFIVDNSQGAPRIVEDIGQLSPRFSGQTWISIPYDQITIAPNDKVAMQAKINVPVDARPVDVMWRFTLSQLPQYLGQ